MKRAVAILVMAVGTLVTVEMAVAILVMVGMRKQRR